MSGVERNALKANLVNKAEEWKWESAYQREYGMLRQKKLLASWPVQKPKDYMIWLNQPQLENEEDAIEKSIQRGNPYGDKNWS